MRDKGRTKNIEMRIIKWERKSLKWWYQFCFFRKNEIKDYFYELVEQVRNLNY